MTLWQRINEKWNTLPPDSVAEEFKPRMMLHLAHGFGFSVLASTGWQIAAHYGLEFFGQKWHWALSVTLLMFSREMLQRLKIKERMWSCLFDTVQVLIVWFIMFLSDAKWLEAGVSLIAFCVLYVIFLLKDDDWIEEEKK